MEFYQKNPEATKRKSKDEEARIIKNELLPAWRDRKVSEITRADVEGAAPTHRRKPRPSWRTACWHSSAAWYNLALAEDVKGITTNPAMRLPKPGGKGTITRPRAHPRRSARALVSVRTGAATAARGPTPRPTLPRRQSRR